MPTLTKQQLSESNPKKPHDLHFSLNSQSWTGIVLPVAMPPPIIMKFDDNIRANMQQNVKYLKGIYVFVVEHKLPIQPDLSYIVYIGRVIKGNTFFNRFREYVKAIGNISAKRNRQIMANSWPHNTSVYFYNLTNDIQISSIEKILIDAIVPPLNNQFYSESARNSRSIYN